MRGSMLNRLQSTKKKIIIIIISPKASTAGTACKCVSLVISIFIFFKSVECRLALRNAGAHY